MRILLSLGLALLLPLMLGANARSAAADEMIDSGWIAFTPEELGAPIEWQRVVFDEISVLERTALQTDALTVIKMDVHVRSKVDYDLYFDLDVLARDGAGNILFTMTIGPEMLGLWPGQDASYSESRYVPPGTLDRVATYELRYLGFR